ncbi:YbdD/YjiX family protein [Leucobacter manosquensis]|uniref:YbdD/YjiX family protein n=1 Tax=Leucobacter manosquensis TaxID=2810611 RepID=UPI00321199B9
MRQLVRAIGAGGARLRWFCRELFGDAKYERYVAHLRVAHPDAPVPDVRTFWREHYAEQDRNPGARCC